MTNIQPVVDFPLEVARWLAWFTLALVGLIVLSLLVLRWLRWRDEPRLAAFKAHWQPVLLRCALGDDVAFPTLPTLSRRERWPFMKLWLHCQMSLHGPCRQRLAALGQHMGCRDMALARLTSNHYSERMIGILTLGFLQDAASVPTLQQLLTEPNSHAVIYAARGLLEIDQGAHSDIVVHALLHCAWLDYSLASVLLKPFRLVLGQAIRRQCPASHDSSAGASEKWLRLVRALKIQIPQTVLRPFLQAGQDTETLIAAIRLVQGEQGAEDVVVHTRHSDWRVRAQAARALGFIGDVRQADSLVQLTTDAQWWVRYRSAQALLRLPGLSRPEAVARVTATNDHYALSMLHSVLAERGQKA